MQELREVRADLHIHTCLSPCGDLRMSPRNITGKVLEQEIDLIAICDHNSARNAGAVMRAAEGKRLRVLPGMELCTREEIHILAIFENLEPAIELTDLVSERLSGTNDPDAFGLQVLADEFDQVLGFEEKLLIGATDLSLEEGLRAVHALGGLAIASHVDRESFSVLSQLGFIPEGAAFDALEISRFLREEDVPVKLPAACGRYPRVRSSDAHMLADIGQNSGRYLLVSPSWRELRMALRGEGGRCVVR